MTIETLPFAHRPRNSIANNLDKINELVDWVNLDTHLYASASGERVTVDDTSSLKGLTVDGRSVQDGTPTPDAPVPVQVVSSKNLLDVTMTSQTMNGLTFTVNPDKTISVTGTASDNTFIAVGTVNLPDGIYRLSGCPEGGSRTTYRLYYNRSGAVEFDYGRGVTITADNDGSVQVRLAIYTGTTVDIVFKPQIERGSLTTAYAPYGCIALYINDTLTAINLQGNVLASLPDGTRDELHIDSAGRVWIEKRTGRILTPTDVSSVNNLTQVTGGARWNIDVDGLASEEIPNGSTNGYCSHTPFSRTLALGSLGSHVFTFGGKVYYIVEGDFTASMAVTWVNSHQMTIIYPLATPQTIDLGYIDPPAITSGSVVTISASLTPEFMLEWWVDDGITELVDDLIAYVDYKTEG